MRDSIDAQSLSSARGVASVHLDMLHAQRRRLLGELAAVKRGIFRLTAVLRLALQVSVLLEQRRQIETLLFRGLAGQ